jgi:ABC-type Mn2+/Zn2+ transport system ATPase subunit
MILMATSTDAIATATDVCVHYGDVVALHPTSLQLESGTSVALVGPNGSGKSTLLGLLAGLVRPTSGEVRTRVPVAMVTQHPQHHQWMPLAVDDVLRMGRYSRRGLLGPMRREDRAAIDAAAERLEVDGLRRRAFGDLSGGQQQRVLVAQAVAAAPGLLLLDEPITGLDLASQRRILEVIAESTASGTAVVFSTHHLGEARRADRVLLLAGCVIADGTPADVLRPELLAEAFGSRLVRQGATTVVVDEHGHEHDHHHHHDAEQPVGGDDEVHAHDAHDGRHDHDHHHDHHNDHHHDHHDDRDAMPGGRP